ncbi:acyl-CoA-binding domain-containing protein 7 isoform X3 [Microtus oregoni]|uniref:acyl-CoA-binding domain-containing protein 7 isoform X3 n=1 Tax=Microtus oregoni TaxID=111838 RepID=UPI001BB1DFD3|nr:acyl-CoA-binding domain-containing protein 7 isoform X3 [Microtus oregoni]
MGPGNHGLQIPATANFEQAAQDVRKLKRRPEDEELKELYGLYKQSILGDINIGGTCMSSNVRYEGQGQVGSMEPPKRFVEGRCHECLYF